ncbi:MAG TPA: BadF/BadG/BcrA/BcrD ATPase family protein [Streptosporangiaceae bacterium]|nr:BadF/BadG/BcrA/BcrD ATPase family protein [Streptosporangiaceae bacterium]
MSQAAAAVLAIDGGNSKTEVALVAPDGTLLAMVRGGPSNHQVIGSERATKELTTLVKEVGEQAGIATDGPVAQHTSACLAGADLPIEEADLGRLVQSLGWSATSEVVNDTFAVLRAGLPDTGPHWGIGVVCGAGINCVGVAPDGRTTRFLSLGELSGDWGGGGDLGPQALWWAARAEDGRGPETELRTAVPAHFGLSRVEDVIIAMHFGTISIAAQHELVPLLFAVAGRGDKVAQDVVLRQATEICLMATVAAGRLDLSAAPGVPVVLGGSLMTARDPLLSRAVSAELTATMPGAQIRVVDVPPVVGAALLGLDHVGAAPAAAARLRECASAAIQAGPPSK